jgi:hypothetical protein
MITANVCRWCPADAIEHVDVKQKDGTFVCVWMCKEHWDVWAERATKFAKASKLEVRP